MKKIFLCLSFIVLFPTIAFADAISMKNGEKLECFFLQYSNYAIEIFSHGQKRTLKTEDIHSIIIQNFVKVRLNTGEVAIGTLSLKNKTAEIHSRNFRVISVNTDDISSIATMLTESELNTLYAETTKKTPVKDQTVGKEQDAPPQEFLRGSTVLRKTGEVELAISFAYDRGRYDNPLISTMFGVIANETRQRFTTDLSVSAGLHDRLEAWINLPFQYIYLERVEGIYKDKKDNGNIGDVSAGLRFLAVSEGVNHPSVMVSADVTAPTGSDPYSANPYASAVATGRGNWGVRTGLNFVTSSDPLVFFYGASYQYEFSATHHGTRYKRGDRIGYYGGFGFAVNDRTSLSTRVFGEHVFESKKDGEHQYGTSLDPVSVGMGLNYRTTRGIVVNPYVNVGANDDAPDFLLGLSLSKAF